MICSSVCLLRFIVWSFRKARLQFIPDQFEGATSGLLHARELDNGVNVFNLTNTSFSTFHNAFGFGSSQFTNQSTSLSANSANMTGAQSGGIANLSLGFNWMLVGNFVSGVQIEGGLSNIQARLTGIGMSTSTGTGSSTSTSTSTVICPTCNPPNPTTSFTTTSTSPPTIGSGTQSVADTLASRWFVSALARGGFLIDPIDMVYAIGAGRTQASRHHKIRVSSGFMEQRLARVWRGKFHCFG